MACDESPPALTRGTTLRLRRRIKLAASIPVALTVAAACILWPMAGVLPESAAFLWWFLITCAAMASAYYGIRHVQRLYSPVLLPLMHLDDYFDVLDGEVLDEERSKALGNIDTVEVALRRTLYGLPAAPADRLEPCLEELRAAVQHPASAAPPVLEEMRTAVEPWHDAALAK